MPNHVQRLFARLARSVTQWAGSCGAFLMALSTILIWAPCGPIFHYSDTWQLVANTGTTLVTYLMVFLIQHSQNHEGRAIQLKLDAIAESLGRERMMRIEHLSDDDLRAMEERVRVPQAPIPQPPSRRRIGKPSPTLASRISLRTTGTSRGASIPSRI